MKIFFLKKHKINNIKISQIECGETHSLALNNKGHIYCQRFGVNDQLGLGFYEDFLFEALQKYFEVWDELYYYHYYICFYSKKSLKYHQFLAALINCRITSCFRSYAYILIIIKNTDLIIYIDRDILCINIKTGELITYFKIKEETKFDIYLYCLLTNNIFLVFIGSAILKFEFSENKIKQIQANFDLSFSGEINYIYKIFNEHYLLVNENIFFEKT